jgi:hypothetical protein
MAIPPPTRDLHYTNGRFEPIPDIVDATEGVIDELVGALGWLPANDLGTADYGMQVNTWYRSTSDGPDQFLIQISTLVYTGPFILCDDYADLMDVYARWAPAIQAFAVTDLVKELTTSLMPGDDAVEKFVARLRLAANRAPRNVAEHERHLRQTRGDR